MKVTFVYTDYGLYNQNNFNRGIALLSACLKQKGHNVSLIHISKKIDKKEFQRIIEEHNPGLIAFSFISNMFSQVKTLSLWVKELNVAAIHGGRHPTVAPEECLAADGINIICRGEGEGAIVDICDAIESGKDIKSIPNIWVKANGEIYKNSCRNLIENLDLLPYPDYELFDYENLEEGFVHKILVTQSSRGCYYNCSYCCNASLKSLYANKEKFVRHYSVGRLLDEIKYALEKYPFLQEVRFYDDAITQDKEWFKEFTIKYKKEIDRPYSGNERAENINEDTVRLLKESGCVSLDIGIENGNANIREGYMRRRVSNERIIEAFSLLQAQGISTNSFNILGMAGETPQTVLETIKLNAAVRPKITFNSYFYPFKGTEAYELVKDSLSPDYEKVSSFFEMPVVKLETITKAQIIFFYKYFYFLMRIYVFLFKICGSNAKAIKILERVLSSRYFPYAFLSYVHLGKDDIISFLRRQPRLYLSLRKIYRFVRGQQ